MIQSDKIIAVFNSLDQANALRKELMNREERLWVLVYPVKRNNKNEFEVAVQNSWGGAVANDVRIRCIEFGIEFKANATITTSGSGGDVEFIRDEDIQQL